MDAIISAIESLRKKLDKYHRDQLREYATRVIFIDPLLDALGWDVRDPDQAELEYPTSDGQAIDYAMKLNDTPCLFMEARPLNDPLTDEEAVVRLVKSAASAGVQWCVLTNGVTYETYRSTEEPAGAAGFLFVVSIDPTQTVGMSIERVAELFSRFSRDAMTKGVLDELGERVFTTAKVRRAVAGLLGDPPAALIDLVRTHSGDRALTSAQIGRVLKTLWGPEPQESGRGEGVSQEVTELFRSLDRFCKQLDPDAVDRQYLARSVAYAVNGEFFCSVRLEKTSVRVWLVMSYKDLDNPPDYAHDVSDSEHAGVGDIELVIDNLDTLETATGLVRLAFSASKAG